MSFLKFSFLYSMILVVLPVFQLYAQHFVHRKLEIESPNKKYLLQIEGLTYDSFIGPQLITIKNEKKDVYFKDSLEIKCPQPIISDQGLVALQSVRDIIFLNKYGKEINRYTINESYLHFCQIGSVATQLFHTFSNYNGDYYTFLIDKFNKKYFLLSFSETGDQNWQVDLNGFLPEKIITQEKYIILDEHPSYNLFEIDYTSKFNVSHMYIIITIDGKIVKEYRTCISAIDLDNYQILCYDDNVIKSYNLYNPDEESIKIKPDFINLLHQDNENCILFSLYIIRKEQLQLNYSEEDKERILMLAGHSNKDISYNAQKVFMEISKIK